MSISNNNIDKIFANGLESHEVKPRSQAWEKLENKLQNKKKRIIPIWQKLAIAASVALILVLGGISYFPTNSPNEQHNLSNSNSLNTVQSAVNETFAIAPMPKDFNQNKSTKLTPQQKNREDVTKAVLAGNNMQEQVSQVENNSINKSLEILNEIPEVVDTDFIVAENNVENGEKEPSDDIKEEELTILFTVANFENTPNFDIEENVNNAPKEKKKYLPRLFKQLVNAKNGDKVNWDDLGFKPAKIFARAENKLKSTKNDINDTYQAVKDKTIF